MSNQEQEIDYNDRLRQLEQKIARLEKKLALVADVDRYENLLHLLEAGDFRGADWETRNLILELSGHQSIEMMKPDDLRKIPCSALRIIDRLWLQNSDNRFGYSVQLSIYQEVGGTVDTLRIQDIDVFNRYADKVQWRVDNKLRADSYEDWDFSIKAPRGCFPAASWKTSYGLKMVNYFFTRLLECEIY